MYKASDIMTQPVISIEATASADECIGLMLRHHISGLPVADSVNRLVGVVTELDVIRLLHDPLSNRETPVSAFMTAEVTTVDAEASLIDVAEQFMAGPYRRLPVLSQGSLVGIVARRDVLRHIWQMRLRAASELESKRGEGFAIASAQFE